jgi:DNA processing protein
VLKTDPTLNSLYQLSPTQLQKILHLPLQKIESLYKNLHSTSIGSMLEQYKCLNIQCITVFDPSYPLLLKEIYNPPWVLYAKGNVDLLQSSRKIGMVGTRIPTAYGKRMTEYFVRSLAQKDWTTVSGLASGIDSIVHRSTLNHNGKTIAVIGSGFKHVYPKENILLANHIAADGLLLSEYPPDRYPQKWQFPERNRIISGLSLGTIIMEAKERSGSLITANLALEQNREVFALPGPVDSEFSLGTNLLIQQGAKMIIRPDDIFSEIG